MPASVLDAVQAHLVLEARIGGYEAAEREVAASEQERELFPRRRIRLARVELARSDATVAAEASRRPGEPTVAGSGLAMVRGCSDKGTATRLV